MTCTASHRKLAQGSFGPVLHFSFLFFRDVGYSYRAHAMILLIRQDQMNIVLHCTSLAYISRKHDSGYNAQREWHVNDCARQHFHRRHSGTSFLATLPVLNGRKVASADGAEMVKDKDNVRSPTFLDHTPC